MLRRRRLLASEPKEGQVGEASDAPSSGFFCRRASRPEVMLDSVEVEVKVKQ